MSQNHRASHRGYPADTHKVGDHGGYGGSGHCIQADARGAPGGRDNERGGRESEGEHGATASEITAYPNRRTTTHERIRTI